MTLAKRNRAWEACEPYDLVDAERELATPAGAWGSHLTRRMALRRFGAPDDFARGLAAPLRRVRHASSGSPISPGA